MPPLNLWFTDRSRYTTGTGRCAMERFLRNHFGPSGYGIVRKSESLPLVTGKYFHLASERLFDHLCQTDAFPSVAIIRGAITEAIEKYEARIASRGFRGILASEKTEYVIREQQDLITGLIWTLCRHVLPWIHANYRIIQTETESLYVLDCECGLGSGVIDGAAHDARGCSGITLQLKQDAVGQKREGGSLAYFESKTTGWGGDNWAPQWETKPQLGLGSLGLKEKYGKEITENFVIAAYKGSRKQGKQTGDIFSEAPVQQQSALCYGYLKQGNPPLAKDDWRPSYEWVDAEGKTRRAGRDYEKTSIRALLNSDWPEWVASKQADPSLTPAEFWVHQLPQSVIDSTVYIIGPLNRQDAQIAALKENVAGEEQEIRQKLWDLYELTKTLAADAAVMYPHLPPYAQVWAHPEYQRRLQRIFPASWECRKFGVKHECEFKGLCFKESGWEDPLGGGKFVLRRPHHAFELEQAIGRGLLPEKSEEAEEDDE